MLPLENIFDIARDELKNNADEYVLDTNVKYKTDRKRNDYPCKPERNPGCRYPVQMADKAYHKSGKTKCIRHTVLP